MPPAFLFPESDPPPLDLIPEQPSVSSALSATHSNYINSGHGSSPLGGGVLSGSSVTCKSSNTNTGSNMTHGDSTDAAAGVTSPKSNQHFLAEEYTLPDLFPTHPHFNSSPNLNNNKKVKGTDNFSSLSNNNLINCSGATSSTLMNLNMIRELTNLNNNIIMEPERDTCTIFPSSTEERFMGNDNHLLGLYSPNVDANTTAENRRNEKSNEMFNQRESSGKKLRFLRYTENNCFYIRI